MRRRSRLAAAALLTAVLSCSAADARTLTWARAEDATTLDPHAAGDGIGFTLVQQIYEPLVARDTHGKLVSALAESWTLTADPLVWEFRLRRDVTFHDGSPFSADDVVFSLARAQQSTSEHRHLLTAIDAVTKVDSHLVQIRTRGPTPLLPANLTTVAIMSKGWSERQKATRVPDAKSLQEHLTTRRANGTGPFVLVSRERDLRTVMRRNDAYWGRAQAPLEVTQLVYRPIRAEADRIQALRDGEIDFLQDVPVDELQKLQTTPGLLVNVGPENRAIFIGLNVGQAALASSDVKDRNPLADKRVRQAINIAINRQAIQRNVMRGQAIPTGIIISAAVNGYARRFDQIPPHDLAKARSLMADAGLASGFAIRLNCPNDRYVNDEAICKAIAGQLDQIGIKVSVQALPRAEHVPLILASPPKVDMWLFGWNVPTFDSEYVFTALFHTRTDKLAAWNATRYSSPEVDRLTQSLGAETNFGTRNRTIEQIWRLVQEETIYIPLHLQTLAYAMKSDLDIPVDIENMPKMKFVKFKRTQ